MKGGLNARSKMRRKKKKVRTREERRKNAQTGLSIVTITAYDRCLYDGRRRNDWHFAIDSQRSSRQRRQDISSSSETEKSPFQNDETTCCAAEYGRHMGGDHAAPWTSKQPIQERAGGKKKQAALCLSGGGIPERCVVVGVLQVLARRGLLRHFNCRTCRGGGGSIGGWLSRGTAKVRAGFCGPCRETSSPRREGRSDFRFPSLRANSNFRTPRPD